MATVKSASKARAASRIQVGKPAPKSGARPGTGRVTLAVPDLKKFLNSFKLPGVDVKAIVDSGHADLDAVTLANRRAYQGMQSLARRQSDMLREAAADWRTAVKALEASDADELVARRTALADQVISKTLANVRELAESSARAQTDAYAAAGARLCERQGGLKKVLPRR